MESFPSKDGNGMVRFPTYSRWKGGMECEQLFGRMVRYGIHSGKYTEWYGIFQKFRDSGTVRNVLFNSTESGTVMVFIAVKLAVQHGMEWVTDFVGGTVMIYFRIGDNPRL